MSDVLSLPDAERLAKRTLAAIAEWDTPCIGWEPKDHYDTDRERVDSDLAGLRECWPSGQYPLFPGLARRFSDNLRRTATLYGVTS